MALENAAIRTFDLDYTNILASEPWVGENLGAYTLPQILSNLSQTNGSICPDTRLLIVGCPCQKLEQVSINSTVTQLVDYRKHSFDGLFSDNRCDIGETRSLEINQHSTLN
jgi:hypothetical protein